VSTESRLLTVVGRGPLLLQPDARPATCLSPLAGGGGRYSEAAGWSTHRGPCHLASPTSGDAGEPAGQAGCQLTHPSPGSPGPTWASVVRGDVNSREDDSTCPRPSPAISAAGFTALNNRCMAGGLKACIVISHAAGIKVLTVTCTIPVLAETAPAAGR
jgi:hypothetical protein